MKIDTLQWTPATGWSRPVRSADGADLILYFGSTADLERPDSPWREFLVAHPRAVCAGCSTAGEIFSSNVSDGSIAAARLRFDSVSVRASSRAVENPSASGAVGTALARDLLAPDLRHVLLLCDGLGVNGTVLTTQLRAALPENVYVTGGLAGDGAAFRRTVVGLGAEIGPGRVTAIGFYGEKFRAAWGAAGGWTPFGPRRLITRAESNVLYELDGQPALPLYKRYLGDHAKDLPGSGLLFPLELLPTRDAENGIVRTILAVDEKQQSVTFAGDMPVGQYTRVMKAGGDALVAGAGSAASQIKLPGEGDQLALVVSCVGRKVILGQRVDEEIDAVLRAFPHGMPAIGFYSYGEVCPGLVHGCDLHNQTMTLTVLGEAR
jgi:hypothetical protein